MKIRNLKLREAHKPSNGDPSHCSVAWDAATDRLSTASSSDPSVRIHDLSDPKSPPKVLRHHKDGVTCLALSPDAACLASGSLDHSVKLQTFPGGEFQSNVTRFTLPILSLAFNKSGSLLAAAGDDDGIKLIATIDGSISQVLRGHKGSVTGLSFDPQNKYLASVDGNGTVIYWELASGKALHTLKLVAPDCGHDTSLANMLSWRPDGETLAVPGLKNDVVMYDRFTAETMFSLNGVHEKAICSISWSPNGKYMATSSLDRQVLIWDVDSRLDIDRHKFDHRISCLTWRTNGNALAVIDVMGKFAVWDCPVATCMESPVDGAPNLQTRNTGGLLLFDEDDDQEPVASDFSDNASEDNRSDSAPNTRKRLRRASLPDDSMDDDCDGPDNFLCHIESRKTMTRGEKEISSRKYKERGSTPTGRVKVVKSKMQEAFQPCSTPAQEGKRCFLCYNMLGSITSIENDGYSHIEVDFHDTGRGSRVPAMTDYFGFTMASLGERGSVFANRCKGDKKPSTLMYRPFSSWANNSEWSMRFEAEEVKVVALGKGWVAAITSLNFLRIFTEGGLQMHILSLSGPVVTAAGFEGELAVVTHSSDSFSSGDQMLEVKLYNIASGTMPNKCSLPLSPGSSLSWFGFSEEGQLSAYDSKGMLRVYSNQFGGCWLPIFSVEKVKKSDEENYWIVGLNSSKIFCSICKSPDSYPTVMPKPILTLVDLSFPVASSDLGASDLESELISSSLHLLQTQQKIKELSAVGADTMALDDEAFDLEAARDRCILKLIANCCNGDKLERATELAKMLSMEKSVKAAIKLVTALKLPILAERFSGILEERLYENSKKQAVANFVTSPVASEFAPCGVPNALQGNITSEPAFTRTPGPPATPSSTPNLSTLSTRKGKIEENCKSGVKAELSKGILRKLDKKEEKAETGECSRKSERKDTNKEACKSLSTGNSTEVTNQQNHRPSNPFMKASNNKETPSLVDSLKKMKQVKEERIEGSNKKVKFGR